MTGVPCNHAPTSWVGIVTADPTFKSPGAQMSVVTCGREACIAKSITKVAGYTNKTARLYTYAELNSEKSA